MSSNISVNVYGTNTDVLSLINTKSVTTVELSTQNPTNQKYNVTFNRQVAIRTSDITGGFNGYCLNGEQKYTFGPAQPPLWVAGSNIGSTAGNNIAFSTNGLTWNGLGYSFFGLSIARVITCYNGRIWVAVSSGLSAYSWDGKTWNASNLNTLIGSIQCLTWNGKTFIAGGYTYNSVAFSYDGINWISTANNKYISNTYSISSNGYITVIVGYNTSSIAGLAYSYDGITWTSSPSSTAVFLDASGNGMTDIAWNGIAWVAVGNSGNTIGYSSDGINWNPVPLAATYLPQNGKNIIWNGTLWIATSTQFGVIAYTSDPTGQTGWVRQSISSYLNYLKWNGKYVIAGGQGLTATFKYSLNGINWVNIASPVNLAAVTGLEYNSLRPHSITIPRYTVVAGGGVTNSTSFNSIAVSYDGTTWTNLLIPLFTNFCTWVQYNGKIWIASGGTGGNTLAYSYNGTTWSGLKNSVFQYLCYTLCWNGSFWLAGGRDGGNSIAISYDGLIWIPVLKNNTIFTSTSTTGGVQSIAWNGSLFVATGTGLTASNCIAYSTNGTNWYSINQPIFNTSNMGQNVCWNGFIWVATGNGANTLAYSYNGTSWTGSGNVVFSTYGWNVAWNGTMFIATGAGTNYAAYSYNGIIWNGITSIPSFTSANGAYGIAWDGSRWQIGSTATTNSAYSYDGITWTTYTNTFAPSGARTFGSTYGAPPNVYIQHPTVAVGTGQNTIAYSEDGITWKGLGQNIFDGEGYNVAWNGSLWVAVGLGSVNTMAISQDGLQWTGLGNSTFSTSGSGIGWNGTYWVATGSGANTLAYSQNGTYWFGLGSSVFTQSGSGVGWNGTAWLATGQGGNTLAYSLDSINWTGIGSTTFSTLGYAIATNGIYWVATGQGSNCMAYTTDITGATGWTAITGVFDTTGFVGSVYGIAWNGSTWVAVGQPAGSSNNKIAYSTTGNTWTGISNTPFAISGLGVCWNGVRFVATGYGGNSMAYSPDGIKWYGGYNGFSTGSTSQIFTTYGNAVASNPGVGAVPIQSQMVLNPGLNGQSSLDIVAPAYYQPGYSGISVKIEQNNVY